MLGSSYPGVAQFGSALEWGSRGRKFKSSHSDQRFNKKHRAICSVFFITLSRKRKRELLSGSDAIADFKFKKKIIVHMSEQSLFRRCAPYKSSHSDHIRAIKKILPHKKSDFIGLFSCSKAEIRVSKTIDIFCRFFKTDKIRTSVSVILEAWVFTRLGRVSHSFP